MTQEHEAIRRLIHLSGRLLDEQDFKKYAALYSEAGQYRLVVKAPEVAKPMTWVHLSRPELAALLASAPEHVWNTGERNHLISVEDMEVQGQRARSSAGFCVLHTDSGGASRVYAVGRYEDTWTKDNNDWRLVERIVRLRTRSLSPSSAIPL